MVLVFKVSCHSATPGLFSAVGDCAVLCQWILKKIDLLCFWKESILSYYYPLNLLIAVPAYSLLELTYLS